MVGLQDNETNPHEQCIEGVRNLIQAINDLKDYVTRTLVAGDDQDLMTAEKEIQKLVGSLQQLQGTYDARCRLTEKTQETREHESAEHSSLVSSRNQELDQIKQRITALATRETDSSSKHQQAVIDRQVELGKLDSDTKAKQISIDAHREELSTLTWQIGEYRSAKTIAEKETQAARDSAEQEFLSHRAAEEQQRERLGSLKRGIEEQTRVLADIERTVQLQNQQLELKELQEGQWTSRLTAKDSETAHLREEFERFRARTHDHEVMMQHMHKLLRSLVSSTDDGVDTEAFLGDPVAMTAIVNTAILQTHEDRARSADMKSKHNNLVAKYNDLLSKYKALNEANKRPTGFTAQLEAVNSENKLLTERVEGLETERDGLSQQLEESHRGVADTQKRWEFNTSELRKEIDNLNNEKSILTNSLKNLEELKGTLTSWKSESQHTHNLALETASQQHQRADLEHRQTALQSRVQDQDTEIADLKQQLARSSTASSIEQHLDARLEKLVQGFALSQEGYESHATSIQGQLTGLKQTLSTEAHTKQQEDLLASRQRERDLTTSLEEARKALNTERQLFTFQTESFQVDIAGLKLSLTERNNERNKATVLAALTLRDVTMADRLRKLLPYFARHLHYLVDTAAALRRDVEARGTIGDGLRQEVQSLTTRLNDANGAIAQLRQQTKQFSTTPESERQERDAGKRRGSNTVGEPDGQVKSLNDQIVTLQGLLNGKQSELDGGRQQWRAMTVKLGEEVVATSTKELQWAEMKTGLEASILILERKLSGWEQGGSRLTGSEQLAYRAEDATPGWQSDTATPAPRSADGHLRDLSSLTPKFDSTSIDLGKPRSQATALFDGQTTALGGSRISRVDTQEPRRSLASWRAPRDLSTDRHDELLARLSDSHSVHNSATHEVESGGAPIMDEDSFGELEEQINTQGDDGVDGPDATPHRITQTYSRKRGLEAGNDDDDDDDSDDDDGDDDDGDDDDGDDDDGDDEELLFKPAEDHTVSKPSKSPNKRRRMTSLVRDPSEELAADIESEGDEPDTDIREWLIESVERSNEPFGLIPASVWEVLREQMQDWDHVRAGWRDQEHEVCPGAYK